jgi:hypothetical protein
LTNSSTNPTACRLCRRLTKSGTTEHHLIPRTCHKNKWFKKNFTRQEMSETISVCRDCHRYIHKAVPKEKELGRFFNTVEKLLNHETIGRFVEWASKQK